MMKKFQVVLPPDCIAHGGRGEYPDGWVGTETIPPRIAARTMADSRTELEEAEAALAQARKARKGGVREAKAALQDAQGRVEQSAAEAITAYANCGPRAAENLRYIRFGRHFGDNTDAETGMWVPAWLLNPVPEPQTEPVAA